jgi:hypothetical protein
MWNAPVDIRQADENRGAARRTMSLDQQRSDRFDRPIRYMRDWGRNHTDCCAAESALACQLGDVER